MTRLILLGAILLSACTIARAADVWSDVSSPLTRRLLAEGAKSEWPGGCSGVTVNRTNGEVTIKLVGLGLWRSSDKGTNWGRIDNDTLSGRDETGWATTLDANEPGRMASFSLDGSAGWTRDGVRWTKFTGLGRNWDYGSVDWADPAPKTIIAARHETTPPGEVYLSQDGGVNWRLLSVHLAENRGRISMVGAAGGGALIYSNGDGIHRSADGGATWSKVSAEQPQTRIPVLFRGSYYLGTTNGLLASKDQGRTWRQQGSGADVWQGPFFGTDEAHLVVVGKSGVLETRDAGSTWQRLGGLKPKEGGFEFLANWFGCYAWDPVNRVLYASSMGNPVYRLTP